MISTIRKGSKNNSPSYTNGYIDGMLQSCSTEYANEFVKYMLDFDLLVGALRPSKTLKKEENDDDDDDEEDEEEKDENADKLSRDD